MRTEPRDARIDVEGISHGVVNIGPSRVTRSAAKARTKQTLNSRRDRGGADGRAKAGRVMPARAPIKRHSVLPVQRHFGGRRGGHSRNIKTCMKRVAAFGNASGGESLLVRHLVELTRLPLYRLDLIRFKVCEPHLAPGYRQLVADASRSRRVHHLNSATQAVNP